MSDHWIIGLFLLALCVVAVWMAQIYRASQRVIRIQVRNPAEIVVTGKASVRVHKVRVVCAWCEPEYTPASDEVVTHGACPECAQRLRKQMGSSKTAGKRDEVCVGGDEESGAGSGSPAPRTFSGSRDLRKARVF